VRARLVAAILSLALIYAFTCSATCAICLGAGAAAETQSHACEHAAGGSHQQEPAKPDCIGHHHSDFNVVPSDGHLRFQLSVTGRVSVLAEGEVGTDSVNLASSYSSDLAPPRVATIFLQHKTSILRI
jgi:predicted cobalt transporter CbtA